METPTFSQRLSFQSLVVKIRASWPFKILAVIRKARPDARTPKHQILIYASALVTFLTSIVCLFLALAVQSSIMEDRTSGGRNLGVGGNCIAVREANRISHILINIISTFAIAAGGSTIQVLLSPTRRDIDRAHAIVPNAKITLFRRILAGLGYRRWWLIVGQGLSLKNLPVIERMKSIMVVVMLPLMFSVHLLFNSTVYSIVDTWDYSATFVTPDFFNPQTEELTSARSQYVDNISPYNQWRSARVPWLYVKKSDCALALRKPMNYRLRNMILISDDERFRGNLQPLVNLTLLQDLGLNGTMLDLQPWANSGTVIWSGFSNLERQIRHDMSSGKVWAEMGDVDTPKFDQDGIWRVDIDTLESIEGLRPANEFVIPPAYAPHVRLPRNISIEYCIGIFKDQQCELCYSAIMLLATGVVMLVMSMIMLVTAQYYDRREEDQDGYPLVTVGDAMESFLLRQDDISPPLFLLKNSNNSKLRISDDEEVYKIGKPSRKSFWKATSWGTWTCFLITTIAFGGALSCLEKFRFQQNTRNGIEMHEVTVPALLPMNFTDPFVGNLGPIPNQPLYVFYENPSAKIFISSILAGLVHPPIVYWYLQYGSILAAMTSAREWTSFAVKRQGLRVSLPVPGSSQRSSFLFHIPFPLGLALLATGTFLHWLAAQGLFLQNLRMHRVNEDWQLATETYLSLSFSGPNFYKIRLVVFSLTVTLFASSAVWGLFGRIPIARGSSFIIAAACHPSPDEFDACKRVELPLKWGLLSSGQLGELDNSLNTSEPKSESISEIQGNRSSIHNFRIEVNRRYLSFSAQDVDDPVVGPYKAAW